jgi:hypothetical protein
VSTAGFDLGTLLKAEADRQQTRRYEPLDALLAFSEICGGSAPGM